MDDGARPPVFAGLALALLVAACSTAGAAVGTTVTPATPSATATTSVSAAAESIDVNGVDRRYLLHVPTGVVEPAALVIDLHGFGSTPEVHGAETRMTELADAEGFILAQPYARGEIPVWNPQPDTEQSAEDLAFIRAIVDAVASTRPIDPHRVYVVGHSNGGGMAHRVACDAADLVAAVAMVSGQYPLDDTCEPIVPVSVLAFHGTDDRFVPYRGVSDFLPDVPAWAASWGRRLACADRTDTVDGALATTVWSGCDGGAEVRFITLEGAGHAWPGGPEDDSGAGVDATGDIWRFFEAHSRS